MLLGAGVRRACCDGSLVPLPPACGAGTGLLRQALTPYAPKSPRQLQVQSSWSHPNRAVVRMVPVGLRGPLEW